MYRWNGRVIPISSSQHAGYTRGLQSSPTFELYETNYAWLKKLRKGVLEVVSRWFKQIIPHIKETCVNNFVMSYVFLYDVPLSLRKKVFHRNIYVFDSWHGVAVYIAVIMFLFYNLCMVHAGHLKTIQYMHFCKFFFFGIICGEWSFPALISIHAMNLGLWWI